MPRIPAIICAVALLAGPAAACSADGPGDTDRTAPAKPPPTYNLPPRAVRPDESAPRVPTVRSGDLAFTVIGLRDRMDTVAGSHADVPPDGQFVRVRLVVENTGRITATFDTRKQLLVAAGNRTFRPDLDAMLIRRQPTEIDVGSGVRIEMDLWYDIPKNAKAAALRLVGSPTLGAVSDPPPADVRLT
jgi:hypothetical protein